MKTKIALSVAVAAITLLAFQNCGDIQGAPDFAEQSSALPPPDDLGGGDPDGQIPPPIIEPQFACNGGQCFSKTLDINIHDLEKFAAANFGLAVDVTARTVCLPHVGTPYPIKALGYPVEWACELTSFNRNSVTTRPSSGWRTRLHVNSPFRCRNISGVGFLCFFQNQQMPQQLVQDAARDANDNAPGIYYYASCSVQTRADLPAGQQANFLRCQFYYSPPPDSSGA